MLNPFKDMMVEWHYVFYKFNIDYSYLLGVSQDDRETLQVGQSSIVWQPHFHVTVGGTLIS